ncbi:hypothetical protein FQR65_LT11719 [Abscondita terminalis]|nr:hypothetical protein FQR65_LT11719 [Abscondita terminalis]
MYMLIILFLIVLFSCYCAISKKFDYWKERGVPHAAFSKLFGNVSESIRLKKSLGQIYYEIYKAYPNLRYVGIYKLRQPALLIRDPELIKNVLITDFSYFHDNDAEVDKENDYLMSKNPFLSKGTDWKINRGQLAPSLTSNKIKTVFPLMETVCQNFINYLDDPNVNNERINSKTFCEKYTMDVAALSVLGLEANSFKSINTDYLSNIKKIVSPGVLMSIKFTLLKVMPIMAKFLKIKYIPDDAAIYFKNIIKSTLHFRQENNIIRNDFLNTMQELKDKLGPTKFTVDDITAHCLSFFIDGFETSSIVLSFALYDLGANVEQQDILRKKIENSVKYENNKITYESIYEITHLDNVLNESMRLHSPALFLSRRCTKAYQLPPADNNARE